MMDAKNETEWGMQEKGLKSEIARCSSVYFTVRESKFAELCCARRTENDGYGFCDFG